jgi:zinc/manganese transport system substrate-binding protein
MKRLGITTVAFLSILFQTMTSRAQEKINVVATVAIIGDMVANVGGDDIHLTTIVGPGEDTELYDGTAGDLPRIATARILFMNGLNDEFEPWLPALITQSKFAGTKVIVSRGVKALTAEDASDGWEAQSHKARSARLDEPT